MSGACVFCEIAEGRREAALVLERADTIAFLDHRPLFPGHCLVVPRRHLDTLLDLPKGGFEPLFEAAQLVARAVEEGLGAEGSFVAINNRISQSVPHLHVHVIPRRKGDGLKGFFWPRQGYDGPEQLREVRDRLRTAVRRLERPAAGLDDGGTRA
jgi:histidine triad (HIT) family protein